MRRYQGFVRSQAPVVPVASKDCTRGARAFAVMLGQGLAVKNENSFMMFPELRGAAEAPLLAAMPGGDPVTLYPTKLGLYELRDASHVFLAARVFAFLYPTTAVTDVAGRYRIDGVPVGKARLDALWALDQPSVGADIELAAGQVLTVDLTLSYAAPAADGNQAGAAGRR